MHTTLPRHWPLLAMLVVGLVLSLAWAGRAAACPFCSAVSVTLGEEMKGASAAVIAKLVELPQGVPASGESNAPPVAVDSKAKFEIVEVLKGKEIVGDAKQIEVLYFGQDEKGKPFLILGTDAPNVAWNTPIALTDRAVEYILKLPGLPEKGADRLAFFQEYFEDAEQMLATDSYDEFAKAPYAELKELKPRMNHDKLVERIKDPNVPPSRRRLYLTMLGVCGSRDDLPLLEEIIRSDDRETKTALDAIIACYLSLGGVDGLPLVEERFLKNPDAEYTDTYAAIMALRFHGQEEQIVPKERIVAALRLMLDRPQLADLVIPDLARWEDWSALDRLVALFKEANDDTSWVRVPVINYLKACPLPKAKEYIDELAQIDPDAVKRANSFFPLVGAAPPPVPVPADQPTPAAADGAVGDFAAAATKADTQSESPPAAAEEPASAADSAGAGTKSADVDRDTAHDAEKTKVAAAATAKARSREGDTRGTPAWIVVAVPVVGGLLLLALVLFVLRGQRRQAST